MRLTTCHYNTTQQAPRHWLPAAGGTFVCILHHLCRLFSALANAFFVMLWDQRKSFIFCFRHIQALWPKEGEDPGESAAEHRTVWHGPSNRRARQQRARRRRLSQKERRQTPCRGRSCLLTKPHPGFFKPHPAATTMLRLKAALPIARAAMAGQRRAAVAAGQRSFFGSGEDVPADPKDMVPAPPSPIPYPPSLGTGRYEAGRKEREGGCAPRRHAEAVSRCAV